MNARIKTPPPSGFGATIRLVLVALLTCLGTTFLPQANAQGHAFTYQGLLNDGPDPVQGIFDFKFSLYDSASGGNQVGPSLTHSATSLSNGLFTVLLDFGANHLTGADRFLEIAARPPGGADFEILSPRQQLTPAPYAIFAGSVGSGGLSAGTYGNAVTFNHADNNFGGTFSGNGSGLTALNAVSLASGTVADARLSANVALLGANQVFTGPNRFSGAVTLTNAANTLAGNGAGLTSLNAGNLGSGTVSDARLSANVALLNANPAFTGRVGIRTNSSSSDALNLGGTLRLNDSGLWLRGGGDTNHGLGWYGSGRPFASQQPDGPALFGYGGGLLGTRRNGAEQAALVWTPGGVTVYGTFNNLSDRHAKQDFAPVNTAEVLEKVVQLPIHTWRYKTDPATTHLGPVAQDFHAAFQVGTDERHIAPIDEGGVALAAIQGLNARLTDELKRRDAENTKLKQRLEKLERLLNRNLTGDAK